MTAALAGVESGTVMWSVLAATQDTNDADREPNFGSFRGAVMFTPSRNSVRRLLPTPITVFLDAVQGEVGDDGILRDLSGLPGVVLVSPWATGIEETGWTWEASFALNQREKVSFSFDFMPDEVVDLTRETPVLSSPGVVMTKGDKGDAATVAVGTVNTGAPGSSATVANSGTSAAAVFDFTIPRGDLARVAGTSATSFAIGTGSKVFVTQAGIEAFTVGQYVRITSRANTANFMAGTVTAFAGTNLTVSVTDINGSGTFADWNINVSGVKGNTGGPGIQGDPGDLVLADSASWAASTQDLSSWTTVGTRVRTLSGNVIIGTLPPGFGAAKSGTVTAVIKQAATGGPFTLTWPASLEWAGDALAPAMPTAANAELLVHLFWTGTVWRAFNGGTFFP